MELDPKGKKTEKKSEKICEEIITKIFQNFMKIMSAQIQKSQ